MAPDEDVNDDDVSSAETELSIADESKVKVGNAFMAIVEDARELITALR